MGRRLMVVAVAVAVLAVAATAARAEGPMALGAVVRVTGPVQIVWGGTSSAAAAEQKLFEGQVIRTGEKGAVEVLFDPQLPARVGEKTEIAVADLLLKARLEKTKAAIAAPAGDAKADMQVTPLTGVRGTEKTDEKAGELKREHYWNESAAPAAK